MPVCLVIHVLCQFRPHVGTRRILSAAFPLKIQNWKLFKGCLGLPVASPAHDRVNFSLIREGRRRWIWQLIPNVSVSVSTMPRGILNRTVLSVFLPLPFLLPHLLLSVSPSLAAFFSGRGVHGPSGSQLSSVTRSALKTLWTLPVGVGRERKASSWWQQQQAPLETASGLSTGGNPQKMIRKHLRLLTPLALLGLLVGLADLSHGSVGEDEDYYMQGLLIREQYNQVQVLEKQNSFIPDGEEDPKEHSAKKTAKAKSDSSKKTDKTPADAKTGKNTAVT